MKLFSIILLAFLVSCIYTDCSTDCASCGVKDSNLFCFICKNTQWNEDGNCTTATDPNCEMHSAAGCLRCSVKYYLDINANKCVLRSSLSNDIKNCLVMSSSITDSKQIKYSCSACINSYPNSDLTKCQGTMDAKYCTIGGYNNSDLKTCLTCVISGQISVGGKCYGGSIQGCKLANSNGTCVECITGYAMTMVGRCSPTTSAQSE